MQYRSLVIGEDSYSLDRQLFDLRLVIGTGRTLKSGEYPSRATIVTLEEPGGVFFWLRIWPMERPTTAEQTITGKMASSTLHESRDDEISSI
jgi:hypothetical protein